MLVGLLEKVYRGSGYNYINGLAIDYVASTAWSLLVGFGRDVGRS